MTAPTTLSSASTDFLTSLMRQEGVKRPTEWTNYNKTVKQSAYVLDVKDLDRKLPDLVQRVFQHNQTCEGRPIRMAVVAGWQDGKSLPKFVLGFLGIFSEKFRRMRWMREFSESFSLSNLTTGENADVILRVSQAAQRMRVVNRNGQQCLQVTPGIRITDADEFLSKQGLALPPNMPTLHVGSLVGTAANGSYGPAKNYGSMTTNIVEMQVVTATGQQMTLSDTENRDLFYALKDFHMGAGCIVTQLTLGNVEQNFKMRRQDTLCQNLADFREKVQQDGIDAHEHFVAMYFPVDIKNESDHRPRVRMTTFDRAEADAKITKRNYRKDPQEFTRYIGAELGEPFISVITDCDKAQQAFPLVIDTAARTTFGSEPRTVNVGWSADIAHLFSSYTDSPIHDMNWLIQVENAKQAQELLSDLYELVEHKLKGFAENDRYPLFNAFSRYLKGLHYDDADNHGLAPTGVEKEGQGVLSFELLTYTSLAETAEFKQLHDAVIQLLRERDIKYNYHPGKHFPANLRTIDQLFDPHIRGRGLQVFRDAIASLHGGAANVQRSPLLTDAKQSAIFETGAVV